LRKGDAEFEAASRRSYESRNSKLENRNSEQRKGDVHRTREQKTRPDVKRANSLVSAI
jgi:hypothetical protein